ncbi:MAG: cation-efflux pump [Chloroflexia bacterium]
MDTFRAIRRVLWITMGLNLLAMAAKLGVGYLTGSLSLVADGFDSAFDGASNVVGLVGIYLAARPADEGHPYGHRKAETLTALGVSALLFLTTWELVKSAVERLRDPTRIQAEVTVWSFGALVLSILVHATVVWYEMREGRRLRSDFLVADAQHTRADILVSLGVIGGLVAVRLGAPIADPILALVVALFIAKIGIDIIRETSPTLMDGAMLSPVQVERIALEVPGVRSCHQVRSRGHDRAVYADLHLRVDPEMSVEQAHAIAHEVQNRLRAYRPGLEDVTIHLEPAGSLPSEPGRERFALQLRRLATGLGLEVHDVWAHEIEGRYYVDAHLEADGNLTLGQAHDLASRLEEQAHAEIPELAGITTHLEPRGRQTGVLSPTGKEGDLLEAVRRVLLASEMPLHCHDVQVRRGKDGWTLSLHCCLPEEMTLSEAHRMGTILEERLRGEIPDLERVVVHTEPCEEKG